MGTHTIDSSITLRTVQPESYPVFPYDPPQPFPELSGLRVGTNPENLVYSAVRSMLADLGLDADNFGTAQWNPLGQFVHRGERALIKPNWVLHANQSDPSEIESVVTHSAVVRPIIDYLVLAIGGHGTIEVADAPLQNCDFIELVRRTRIADLLDIYRRNFRNVTFSIIDLRKTLLSGAEGRYVRTRRQIGQSGDPRDYSLVNLGRDSFLADVEHRHRRFRVANYDRHLMSPHHNRGRHEYLVSNTVLSADFLINVPKLKCHVKAGITGALKNLVGINGHKEFLPHHTVGPPELGGDQYPRRSQLLPLANRIYDCYWSKVDKFPRVVGAILALVVSIIVRASRTIEGTYTFDGGWAGNFTIPRTTLDLNHVLFFYNRLSDRLSDDPVRTVLHVVDGVVAGEANGPLRPTPKRAGVLIGGWNPLLVDLCGARAIGLDPLCVSLLRLGLDYSRCKLSRFIGRWWENELLYNGMNTSIGEVQSFGFALPRGWEHTRSDKSGSVVGRSGRTDRESSNGGYGLSGAGRGHCSTKVSPTQHR